MMRISHNKKIFNYLWTGGSLTSIDALNIFGCFRLSARIKDLRDLGWDIKKVMVERNGKRFAKYFLNQKKGK